MADRSQRGFTLIELVSAVALGALLLVALASVQQQLQRQAGLQKRLAHQSGQLGSRAAIERLMGQIAAVREIEDGTITFIDQQGRLRTIDLRSLSAARDARLEITLAGQDSLSRTALLEVRLESGYEPGDAPGTTLIRRRVAVLTY